MYQGDDHIWRLIGYSAEITEAGLLRIRQVQVYLVQNTAAISVAALIACFLNALALCSLWKTEDCFEGTRGTGEVSSFILRLLRRLFTSDLGSIM